MAHPELDEANERQPCRRLKVEQSLTIPEGYSGPWSDELRTPPHEGFEFHSPHLPVLLASGGNRFGFFGHLRATTGADPTPGRDWQRLLCVPIDAGEVMWHQVAISRADLAAGRLESWRSVWVDMDGKIARWALSASP